MGEDIQTKYIDQLKALKMNSKPLINSLTMLAEDYIRDAHHIVNIIENHLKRVCLKFAFILEYYRLTYITNY